MANNYPGVVTAPGDDDYDMSNLSDQDLKAVIGVFTAISERSASTVKRAKAEALNRGIAGNHEPENVIFNRNIIGTVSATTGSRPYYKVSDLVEYGGWLARNGYENMVVDQPVPEPEALTKSFIEALAKKDIADPKTGEIISSAGEPVPGTTMVAGRAETITFKKDRKAIAGLFDGSQSGAVLRLLDGDMTNMQISDKTAGKDKTNE